MKYNEIKNKPLDEMIVISKFGWRVHPVKKTQDFHNGIDLKAKLGSPCYAIAKGKVLISTFNSSLGYYVVILHEGFLTVYCHLQKNGLPVGKVVDAKDVIGYVGSSGSSTGPHLHFEIREGDYISNSYFWDRGKSKNEKYPNSLDPEIYISKMSDIKQNQFERILKEKVNNPSAWLKFIDENKNHPIGKFLPDLIEKLNS